MWQKQITFLSILALSMTAQAHDTWVQTNTNIIRTGDAIHVDLMLGNHGNEHRDFKIASKADPSASTLQVIDPTGKRYDLKKKLVDTGFAPNEGFWTARFASSRPGLHIVAHTFDKVMSYAPERAIKSAKTFFLVSKSLDRLPTATSGFNKVLGHPLELVPESNPITSRGQAKPLTIRLYYKGKPLPNTKVAFIPRGETLKTGFDARYEQKTNNNGRVRFTPAKGNYYLIVAHQEDTKAKGKGYDFTEYSAALTLYVP